jgi:hypothetical protein
MLAFDVEYCGNDGIYRTREDVKLCDLVAVVVELEEHGCHSITVLGWVDS